LFLCTPEDSVFLNRQQNEPIRLNSGSFLALVLLSIYNYTLDRQAQTEFI